MGMFYDSRCLFSDTKHTHPGIFILESPPPPRDDTPPTLLAPITAHGIAGRDIECSDIMPESDMINVKVVTQDRGKDNKSWNQ